MSTPSYGSTRKCRSIDEKNGKARGQLGRLAETDILIDTSLDEIIKLTPSEIFADVKVHKRKQRDERAGKKQRRKEHYDERFKEQNGRCAICSNKTVLCKDHCHETEDLRGLLCYNCNSAIGRFFDSPEICEMAARYLKRYKRVVFNKE